MHACGKRAQAHSSETAVRVRGLYSEVLRFLSQEVRENRGHFIALTARVSPLLLGDFHARNSICLLINIHH